MMQDCGSALMQRFGGAGFCTFVTENALSSVFSLARFFVDFDIHRANLQALATMDAFIFITMDAQKRKVAHWLKKYRNRTQTPLWGSSPRVLCYHCILFISESIAHRDFPSGNS